MAIKMPLPIVPLLLVLAVQSPAKVTVTYDFDRINYPEPGSPGAPTSVRGRMKEIREGKVFTRVETVGDQETETFQDEKVLRITTRRGGKVVEMREIGFDSPEVKAFGEQFGSAIEEAKKQKSVKAGRASVNGIECDLVVITMTVMGRPLRMTQAVPTDKEMAEHVGYVLSQTSGEEDGQVYVRFESKHNIKIVKDS